MGFYANLEGRRYHVENYNSMRIFKRLKIIIALLSYFLIFYHRNFSEGVSLTKLTFDGCVPARHNYMSIYMYWIQICKCNVDMTEGSPHVNLIDKDMKSYSPSFHTQLHKKCI